MDPMSAGATPHHSYVQVCALEVLGEIDLYRVEIRNVDGLDEKAVLFDRKLDAALEVVLVVDLAQLAKQHSLVVARDVVDSHCLAETALDLLRELLDVAL